MKSHSAANLVYWTAYLGLSCPVAYRHIYQPLVKGDTAYAVGAAVFALVVSAVCFMAKRRAEGMDFRRR